MFLVCCRTPSFYSFPPPLSLSLSLPKHYRLPGHRTHATRSLSYKYIFHELVRGMEIPPPRERKAFPMNPKLSLSSPSVYLRHCCVAVLTSPSDISERDRSSSRKNLSTSLQLDQRVVVLLPRVGNLAVPLAARVMTATVTISTNPTRTSSMISVTSRCQSGRSLNHRAWKSPSTGGEGVGCCQCHCRCCCWCRRR